MPNREPLELPTVPKIFKKIFIYLFIYLFIFKFYLFYFWLRWVFIAACGLPLVAVSGGYSSLRCVSFSLWWLLLLWSTASRHVGFSSCGTRALEHRLSSCGARAYLLCGMWDLPGPGLEPVSPALAGGFLTTAPPGKPYLFIFGSRQVFSCGTWDLFFFYKFIYLFLFLAALGLCCCAWAFL